MAAKSSSSIFINKIYGDNILNSAEYSTPLAIAGAATVSNTSDTYAVEVLVKNQSGVVVDTLWVYNLRASKNGSLSWSVSDSATAQRLADGTYTIQALLFDTTVSPTNSVSSTTSSLVVDTTASISISPVDGDWGINAAQSHAAVAISGTTFGVEAGQKVTIKVLDSANHTVATLSTQVAANGTWSANLPQTTVGGVAEGTYSVSVSVTDVAGNTDTSSHSFVVDKTAPTVAITSSGGLTNQASQTIAGTVDVADAGSTVKIFDGTTQIGTATVGANGAWSTSVTLSGQGQHTLTATDTDAAGNTGTSNAVVFTLDTVAPTVAITSSGGLTNQASQTIAGTVDVADAGSTVKIFDGATQIGMATVGANGAWSTNVTLSGQGQHALTATDTDAAGNTGTSNAVVFTLDTVAPTVAITSSGGLTNQASQTIAGTVDVADAGSTVKIFDGATQIGMATVGANGAWSTNVTLSGQGQHALTATDTDAAGNTGTSNAVVFTLDTVAPTVTITSSGGLTNQASQTIVGTVDVADAGSTVKIFDGATQIGTATVGANGAWSTYVTLSGQGQHTLIATDTDAAGNTGSASLTFTLDTTAPAVTEALADDSGASSSDKISSDPALSGSGDANAVVHFSVDGSPTAATATADPSGRWTFTPTGLADGSHTIVASETDAAGNTGTASLTFALDRAPPRLTSIVAADADLTSANSVGYIVTFSEPVSGVDANQFLLITTGVTGASITSVTPVVGSNGTQYTVSIGTGTGDGTIALGLKAENAIQDLAGNELVGGPASFLAGVSYQTGSTPTIGAIGDVNGDGKADLVLPNYYGATVGVYLGNGDGTLQAPTTYSSATGGYGSSHAYLSDLNGDGNLDIVTTNYSDGTVSVLLGNGTGAFAPRTAYSVLSNAIEAVFGDFDGNGSTDLLVSTASGVVELLGNGNGSFNPAQSVTTTVGTIASADVNGDGRLDLLQASNSAVTEFLNLGNGQFGPGTSYTLPAGSTSVEMTSGDVNGDGIPDVIVSNYLDGSVTVLLGDGTGGLGTAHSYSTGAAGPINPILADVNGDGFMDIVVGSDSDKIGVLINNGDGTFAPGQAIDANGTANRITVGDLNGDGLPDVVIGHYFTNEATVLLDSTSVVMTGPAYTINRAPPAVSIALYNDTGSSSSDKITSDPALSGSGDANAVVHFTVDGSPTAATATADGNGNWSFTPTGLADGSHSIVASETDAAGNTGTASLSFTLDTTAPAATASLADDTGASATDKMTSDSALSGSGDPNAVVHFTVDGTPIAATATADGSGHWSFTPTGLADGSHTIVASETDAAGNPGTASLSFTLDTTAPAVTVSLADDTGASATDKITSDPALSGSGDPNAVVHFTVDGTPNAATATADGSGQWSFTPTGLTDGSYTIVASETDAAGNIGTASLTFTLDTTAPAVTAALADDTGASSSDKITSDPALFGSGDANAVVHFTVDGTPIAATATADASGHWSFTATGLADGSHTIVASETDAAGNTGTASLTFTLDRTAPVLAAIPNETVFAVTSAGAVATFSATATDAVDGTDPVVFTEGNTVVHSGDTFSVGTHTITASAIDAAGNTSSETFTITVQASTLPTHVWIDGTTGTWGTGSNWSDGVVPDGKGNAMIGGSGTETVTVSANQAVNVLALNDANATLAVTNGATLAVYGGLVNTAVHEIDLTQGTLLIGGGSQTLDNATINLGLWAPIHQFGALTTDTASQTPAVLTLGPNLTVNGAYGGIQNGYAAGDGVVNQATINVTGYLRIGGYDVSNSGTISGNQLDLYSPHSLNNSGTISGNQLTLEGDVSFSNTGAITTNGTGSIYVSGHFDNEGTISVANGATLTLSDYAYYATNKNNGTISIGSGGRLIFNGSTGSSYALSGSGSFVINQGGTLELQSGTLSETVNFAGAGTLQLDGPGLFTGTIAGLTVGDVIDFAHATLTGAVVNGTNLTVTYAGGQTASYTLAAPLQQGVFVQTTFDGAGGTDVVVTDVALPPPPTHTWIDGTTGTWGTGSNWSDGVVPDGKGNAMIGGSGTETVTVSANQAVNVLALNDANATLAVTNGATLAVYGGLVNTAVHEIDLTQGTLLIGGGSQTLDNATINLGLWAPIHQFGALTTDTASQTPAVLTLGPNLTVNGAYGGIQNGYAAGDGVVNQATINVTGYLRIGGYDVSNSGTISGNQLDLYSPHSLNNSGTISGNQLTLEGDVSFSNTGAITTNGTGSIYVSGHFDNEGTISVANGATLTLSDYAYYATNKNNGTISIGSGGRLIFNGSTGSSYALSGSGSFVINQGGTLELQSGTLSETVNFAGAGTLQLDGPGLFTGTIAGLTVGDVIDFAHATLTGAVVNGTNLTVTYAGGQTASYTLAAPLQQGVFVQTTFDGAGGTDVVVTDVALPPPPTHTWIDGTTGTWGTGSNWSDGVVPDGKGNAMIGGSGTETVTVSANQAVNVLALNDANATLAVTNGATLAVYGGLVNTAVHEIDLTQGTLLIGGGSQTLDNATINLGLWAPIHQFGALTTDTASQTPAVLTLGPNLTVNGAYGGIQNGYAAGDGVVNQATINVTGYLRIGGYDVSNSGTISGNQLDLYSPHSLNNSGTISGNQLTLEGDVSFSNTGAITTNGTGSIYVSGHFDNEGTISVANGATLTLSDYAYYATNKNNGTISIGSGGRLIFNGSTGSSYALSGSGSFVINQGGTLELQSGTLSETVNFAGAGTLQLDGPGLFTGTIAGLTVGDVIDFAHATLTGAVVNGTNLTVTYAGGQTASYTLAAPLQQGVFVSMQLDGFGGTEVVVDGTITAPVVTVNLAHDTGASSTDKITSDPALSGSGDVNAVVHFTVDGTPIAATATADASGHWSFTPTGLADGSHTIVASETDAVGNTGTASLTFTLDTTAPVVTEALVHDTGVSATDKITSDPALSGSGDANAVVHFTVDGTPIATTATADGSGHWSFTPTGLADGSHSIVVSETDAAGNTGTASLSFTLDTTAPVVTEVLAHDIGASVTDKITSDPALSGSGDANAVVHYSVDGSPTAATATADGSGYWSFTPTGLVDGSHTIVASETDSAGNTGTASLTFTLDTTAPAVTEVLAYDTGASVTDKITSDPALAGSGDANAVVHFTVDGSPIAATATADGSGQWSFTPTGLADGSHSIVASETDAAGNIGTASLSFTLDTTAPTVTAALADDTGASSSDKITSDSSLSGSGDANAVVHFTVDGSPIAATAVADGSGHWSFTPTGLADGSHTIVASETDAAGNTGTASLSFTLDTTAPVVTAALADDTGTSSSDKITSDPALAGSGDANAVVHFTVDGTPIAATVTAKSNGHWSFTPTGLADGSHTIVASETDAAGNIGTASLTFTLDTTAPSVAITSPGGSTNQASQTITGAVDVADAGATVTILDGTTPIGTAVVQSNGSWSSTVTLSQGSNSLTARVTDLASNTATSSAVVYTLSTSAPTVTESLVSDTGASATDHITSNPALSGIGLANTVVQFTIDGSLIAATLTTDAQGAWSFTPSGLADGVHTIVASQTDSFGNTGTASLSFTLDTTAPLVTEALADDTGTSASDKISSDPALAGSGDPNALVHFTVDGSPIAAIATADGSGQWSFTPTGLADGSHTIVASETDAAGNTGTASLTFALDTTAPAVTEALAHDTGTSATDKITSDPALSGSGDPNAVVHFTVDGSTIAASATADGSGHWSFTPTGLTDGSHTIVASETDAAGNTGTALLSFTLDTTAPVVTAALAADTGTSSSDKITSDPALSGSGDANAVVHFTVDGTPIAATASVDASGHWSFTPTGLADGSHTIVASETDAAGNTGTASLTFTLDTTAAVVTEVLTHDTGASATDKFTSDPALSGSGDASAVVHFTVDGTPIAATATADGSGHWSFTPTGLVDGSHTIVASETDAAGNTGTASLTFTLDTGAPSLTPVADQTLQATVSSGAVATFSATATDAVDGTDPVVFTEGNTVVHSGDTFGVGAHTITAQVTDAAGNASSETFTITVEAVQQYTIQWTNQISGNWNTGSNWSTGSVPGSQDDVLINLPVTVTFDSGSTAVNTLTTTVGPTLAIAGGTMTIAGASNLAGALAISAGTLALNGQTALGSLTQTGGTLTGAGTVVVTGAASFSSGFVAETGSGTTDLQSGGTLDGGYLALDGGRTVQNDGTFSWTGGTIYMGYDPFDTTVGGSSIVNAAGATFKDAVAGSIVNIVGTNVFTNAGTFATSFASGTTTIGVTFNNSGAVQIGAGGTLNLSAGGSSNSGSFTGGGTLQFSSSYTLGAASSISTANVIVSGGTIDLNGSYSATNTTLSSGTLDTGSNPITLGTTFTQTGGTLTGTGTVVVTGAASFSSGFVAETGSGTTELKAGGTLDGGYLALDGGRTLQNDGSFSWTGGTIYMGYYPFDTTVGGSSIVNAAGATFNDAVAGSIINNVGTNVFTNAGTFATSFSSGTTTIGVTFNNSGTVQIGAGGTLNLSAGGTSNGGSFSGDGTLQFSNSYTLDAASSISTANVIVSGGTIGLNGSYSATNTTLSSGTLDTGSNPITLGTTFTQTGGTLTGTGTVVVTGAASFSSGFVAETGSGTTELKAGGTLDGGYLALDGGRTLQNDGSFSWTGGTIYMGYYPFDTTVGGSSIVNAAGATFNDAVAGSIINNVGTNVFTNAGTFATSFSSGTTTIGVTFNNSGTVQIGAGGTLNLSAGGTSNGGSFSGDGTLQFSNSYTLDAASSISTANVIVSGGTIGLNGSYSATNTTLSSGTLDTGSNPITLGTTFTQTGGTLTGTGTVVVTGAASFSSGFVAETGSGTTELKAGGTLDGGYLALDGGRTLQNDGSFSWTGGTIYMGYYPFDTTVGGSSIVNAAGATFNDAVAGSIINNVGTNVFTNAGTFATSFSSGTTTIGVTFNNSGTVDTLGGTLDFTAAFTNTGTLKADGGSIKIDNAVNDTGVAEIFGSSQLEYGAASNENVTFAIGSTGTLRLDDSQNYTGTVTGLAAGNYLDFSDVSFGANTTVGYAANEDNTGGILTVSDGTHVANIALFGQYLASSFATSNDGHGGTLITDPPPDISTLLTQPHAA
ncbi:Ig-like domain-containing protein [Bradyrhizobium sp. C-145]|uniref:Ig-like domain-containing protein n=1 Tax=Bradyrhizobium sp. C-145 TaxID=574727 RepID=UPI00201B928A|nr:Ig-like domain-containing protein [Bradyrhizobium sp. C-145]UQR65125.1 Ig-like domain-containing protein [Bradyrhizobium sp. C-145]